MEEANLAFKEFGGCEDFLKPSAPEEKCLRNRLNNVSIYCKMLKTWKQA